ncbi:uncharacterized protein LOC126482175 [Schistocerca serialis cubense]|uniref:uncharacterized protein LOC126482175 n=1 Tax=Schistocerca serialis cubense TaxID=2023355 RepID=UPI00214F33A4|nr:uncharacterized protein LOC126482175 [Schistocerca serialis cubense]
MAGPCRGGRPNTIAEFRHVRIRRLMDCRVCLRRRRRRRHAEPRRLNISCGGGWAVGAAEARYLNGGGRRKPRSPRYLPGGRRERRNSRKLGVSKRFHLPPWEVTSECQRFAGEGPAAGAPPGYDEPPPPSGAAGCEISCQRAAPSHPPPPHKWIEWRAAQILVRRSGVYTDRGTQGVRCLLSPAFVSASGRGAGHIRVAALPSPPNDQACHDVGAEHNFSGHFLAAAAATAAAAAGALAAITRGAAPLGDAGKRGSLPRPRLSAPRVPPPPWKRARAPRYWKSVGTAGSAKQQPSNGSGSSAELEIRCGEEEIKEVVGGGRWAVSCLRSPTARDNRTAAVPRTGTARNYVPAERARTKRTRAAARASVEAAAAIAVRGAAIEARRRETKGVADNKAGIGAATVNVSFRKAAREHPARKLWATPRSAGATAAHAEPGRRTLPHCDSSAGRDAIRNPNAPVIYLRVAALAAYRPPRASAGRPANLAGLAVNHKPAYGRCRTRTQAEFANFFPSYST